MFKPEERTTFKYWFAHWCAFQMTALNHRCWHVRFLLHDAEKPWLRFIWKDYKKIQRWHRLHSKHHIEYYSKHKKVDWLAMVVDWECCRFTKENAPLTAREELERKIKQHPEYEFLFKENIIPILNKYDF